jgi:hypothetical protein
MRYRYAFETHRHVHAYGGASIDHCCISLVSHARARAAIRSKLWPATRVKDKQKLSVVESPVDRSASLLG